MATPSAPPMTLNISGRLTPEQQAARARIQQNPLPPPPMSPPPAYDPQPPAYESLENYAPPNAIPNTLASGNAMSGSQRSLTAGTDNANHGISNGPITATITSDPNNNDNNASALNAMPSNNYNPSGNNDEIPLPNVIFRDESLVLPVPPPLTASFIGDLDEVDEDEEVSLREPRRTTRPQVFNERLSRDLAETLTERASRASAQSLDDAEAGGAGDGAQPSSAEGRVVVAKPVVSLKSVAIFVAVVLFLFVIVIVIVLHVEPGATAFKQGVGKYLLIPIYQFVSYYYNLNDSDDDGNHGGDNGTIGGHVTTWGLPGSPTTPSGPLPTESLASNSSTVF